MQVEHLQQLSGFCHSTARTHARERVAGAVYKAWHWAESRELEYGRGDGDGDADGDGGGCRQDKTAVLECQWRLPCPFPFPLTVDGDGRALGWGRRGCTVHGAGQRQAVGRGGGDWRWAAGGTQTGGYGPFSAADESRQTRQRACKDAQKTSEHVPASVRHGPRFFRRKTHV